jgi:hypothetical protein
MCGLVVDGQDESEVMFVVIEPECLGQR